MSSSTTTHQDLLKNARHKNYIFGRSLLSISKIRVCKKLQVDVGTVLLKCGCICYYDSVRPNTKDPVRIDKFVLVQDLVHLIDEITKCPICLERVHPPLCQCQNGHVTCGQCRNQQKNCSLCGLPFITTPPRMLAQLLDAFSRTCKYSKDGCSEPFLVEGHEQLCSYRRLKCWLGPNNQCKWTGKVREWQEHTRKCHKVQTCDTSMDDGATWKYYRFKKWNSFGYFFTVDSSYFLLYVFKRNGMFFQNVRIIPTMKATYLINISLFEFVDHEKCETAFEGTFESSALLDNDNLEDSRNMAGVYISDIEHMIINDYLPVNITVRKIDK